MNKLLKYSHPSASKYNTNIIYSLESLQKELSNDMIKIMFTPVNFKFEEDETKEIKSIDIEKDTKKNKKNIVDGNQ